jgi:hypothetical protein
MKNLKVALMFFVLVIVLTACRNAGLSFDKLGSDFDTFEYFVETYEPNFFIEPADCFEYAELITGFSAEILRGIAATESRFKAEAVGDDGMSFGMFQLHSRWHESRVEKWGEFDPIDPCESAAIAGRIMRENLIVFNGDLRRAVAAYRQGVSGVSKWGVDGWYVDEVLNWRNDPEKRLSFFVFCGITNNEALQDGYKGTGTQNTYKFNDSLAVQVSRRGSSGFPY